MVKTIQETIADFIADPTQRAELISCDAFEELAAMPESSVSHVITDPPYDEKTHKNARSGKGLVRGGASPALIGIDFDWLTDMSFVGHMLAVSRRWVVAFCSLEQLGAYQVAASDAWVRAGVWHRPDGAPQFTGDRPAQACDGIAIMHGALIKKRWNGGGSRAHWTCGVERDERVHPTQKPLELMIDLIEKFTDPGELILDPFAGSATTGVACLRTGRRFLGFERNQAHWENGRDRLLAAQRGLTLEAARSGQTSIFDAMQASER